MARSVKHNTITIPFIILSLVSNLKIECWLRINIGCSIISIIKDALKLNENDFRVITNKLFLASLIKYKASSLKKHKVYGARMDLAIVYQI